MPADSPASERERALQCLTLAIGYEAGYESTEGQEAVAEVILNRVRHSAYPKSICGVVFQGSSRKTGCQFTFTCDGSMRRALSGKVQAASRLVAAGALDGRNLPRVSGATHYHASYVSPYWTASLVKTGTIGAHLFYRMPGASDVSHNGRHFSAAREPVIAALASANGSNSTANPLPTPAAPPAFAPWGLSFEHVR